MWRQDRRRAQVGVGVPGMCAVRAGEMTAAPTGGMAVRAKREEMTDRRKM